MLFTQQEIQAILALLNRLPVTPAEMLFAQGFFERLAAFCAPRPEPEGVGSEMADALAIADALDEADNGS